jgi:hypothetical protein
MFCKTIYHPSLVLCKLPILRVEPESFYPVPQIMSSEVGSRSFPNYLLMKYTKLSKYFKVNLRLQIAIGEGSIFDKLLSWSQLDAITG